jgi:hypothetical protein
MLLWPGYNSQDFKDHICAVTVVQIIIDLTSDTSNDEVQPSGPTVVSLTGDSDKDSQKMN